MNKTFLLTAMRNGAKRIPAGLGVALAVTFLHLNTTVRAADVDLGTANNYAVLANQAISSANPSVINGGNVGLSPGAAPSITGPISITPPNTIDTTDGNALQAQKDLNTAYNVAAGLARTATLTGTDLGGADSDAWGLLLCFLSTAHGNADARRPGRPGCTLRFPNRINPHHGIG